MSNIVYIAVSLDGYIADSNNSIDWLHQLPNPEGSDYGFAEFNSAIDAMLMGRTTYETVLSFDIPWPYDKPVFVLSTTLTTVPEELRGQVEIINGTMPDVLARIQEKGYKNLYIDGGLTIQSLIAEDLIDEMGLTRIPVVLGGGSPLFGKLLQPQWFEHTQTKVHSGQLVQSHYRRKRDMR